MAKVRLRLRDHVCTVGQAHRRRATLRSLTTFTFVTDHLHMHLIRNAFLIAAVVNRPNGDQLVELFAAVGRADLFRFPEMLLVVALGHRHRTAAFLHLGEGEDLLQGLLLSKSVGLLSPRARKVRHNGAAKVWRITRQSFIESVETSDQGFSVEARPKPSRKGGVPPWPSSLLGI